MTNKQVNESVGSSAKKLSDQQVLKGVVARSTSVNPFLLMMNFRISYLTWLKHA